MGPKQNQEPRESDAVKVDVSDKEVVFVLP